MIFYVCSGHIGSILGDMTAKDKEAWSSVKYYNSGRKCELCPRKARYAIRDS